MRIELRKIALGLIASACAVSVSSAATMQHTISKGTGSTAAQIAKKVKIAPTEIYINNVTLTPIYVYADGDLAATVYPHSYDHVRSYDGQLTPYIELRDATNNRLFWNNNYNGYPKPVCWHASITVSAFNNYGVMLDESACGH